MWAMLVVAGASEGKNLCVMLVVSCRSSEEKNLCVMLVQKL